MRLCVLGWRDGNSRALRAILLVLAACVLRLAVSMLQKVHAMPICSRAGSEACWPPVAPCCHDDYQHRWRPTPP